METLIRLLLYSVGVSVRKLGIIMVRYVCDLYVFLIFSNMSNVNAWVVCMHKCLTNMV